MTKYDDLFETTTPSESVFTDKRALDPLAEPEEIVAREGQERELATILNGIHEGYLPTTVSIYGPPGTGKTLTTRRVCQEFAARHDDVAAEYINLKECRSLFSAANEILYELTGEKKGAYEGIDGVFEGIWTAFEDYPEWTVLLLDEIDHIQQDTNYDPSDFFYRLLRGEGRLQRDIELSVFLISNELLEVDLRLDSRVQSAMSGEEVFFPPYGIETLRKVLAPRLERAFRDSALPDSVRDVGTKQAARRWGDARKALTLFRQAGETANERGLETVTEECLDANLESTEQAALEEKLLSLPFNHFLVLTVVASVRDAQGDVVQPVTTNQIAERIDDDALAEEVSLGERAIREVLTDLETMALVETWIDSRGRDGRVKQVETTFDPQWIRDAIMPYLETTDQISPDELFASPEFE
ncbi:AAA family ATPase [Natronococcus sp. A-GB1]|uniref:Cdc6/Cdc18 family protein n=1 Tax=Natronococcus sp. A-GB1 TaxID=3037648 RepID=UPI00241CBE5E|nr:AAA family ATPase [Natronococcus sp. A-GB1]MDG5761824.1 AAA family ATPase [Natronococcus sp. A-GB1]